MHLREIQLEKFARQQQQQQQNDRQLKKSYLDDGGERDVFSFSNFPCPTIMNISTPYD